MKRILLAASTLVVTFAVQASAWPPVCKPAVFYDLTGICL